MNIIEATYNSEENGYATEPLQLTGDIKLEVKLSREGYVVIKQKDEDANIFRNVLVSSFCNEYKGKVYGTTKFEYIQIFTSVKPTTIQYEKINKTIIW